MANRTSAKRLEMAARLECEIDLRRMGFSYSQIAAEVGVNKSTVCRDVMRELKRLAAQNEGKTLEHRELELQKLDALEREMQRVMARRHAVLYKGQVVVDTDEKTGQQLHLAGSRGRGRQHGQRTCWRSRCCARPLNRGVISLETSQVHVTCDCSVVCLNSMSSRVWRTWCSQTESRFVGETLIFPALHDFTTRGPGTEG
jgi:glycine/D-amino acid oxidase-like deaminating enzyme